MKKRERVNSGSPYEKLFGFCRAMRVGDTVLVAGTAPIGDDGSTVGTDDPAVQARRCFQICDKALESLGAGLQHVVRTRMFLTRIDDWEAVSAVHGEFFANVQPVATIVEVSRLIDPDWLVEVEVDAIAPRSG